MADVWVVLTIVAFFALCVFLIRGCDHIIGTDESSELTMEAEGQPVEAAR